MSSNFMAMCCAAKMATWHRAAYLIPFLLSCTTSQFIFGQQNKKTNLNPFLLFTSAVVRIIKKKKREMINFRERWSENENKWRLNAVARE